MRNLDFYFPVLFLIPGFEELELTHQPFNVIRRQWDTSTFDLATLSVKHRLHLPYQVMDVFLGQCNLEVCVLGKESLEAAVSAFESVRLALFSEGVSPFLSPFVATYSANDYSGINSRDSEALRGGLPHDLRNGITSAEAKVEVWPFELSFDCVVVKEAVVLSAEQFSNAVTKAALWRKIANGSKSLLAVERSAAAAPRVRPLSQSLLQVWSGLEALLPNVGTELSFKIALYLAQLIAAGGNRMPAFEQVRSSYALRSAVAHGSRRDISMEDWHASWLLLTQCVNAVLLRTGLPNESDLLRELLA